MEVLSSSLVAGASETWPSLRIEIFLVVPRANSAWLDWSQMCVSTAKAELQTVRSAQSGTHRRRAGMVSIKWVEDLLVHKDFQRVVACDHDIQRNRSLFVRALGRTDELVIGCPPALHHVEHGSRKTGKHFLVRIHGRLGFNQGDVHPVILSLVVQQRDRLRDILDTVEGTGNILETAQSFAVAEKD